ncbi:adenosine receptor A2b-like, partial [Protobothrops mucrosquamatus]|uniref:adenosine receptor A2b-like n=1 Tax=Protobothrops mucrosquamatus TaxID=103944 RepID=UPI0010FB0921
RLLRVELPLLYKSMVTGKRARGLIAVLWILSFVIGLTPLLGWNNMEASKNCTNKMLPPDGGRQNNCLVTCLFENVVPMSYMVYFNFFGCVLLPLFIMLCIYVKIFTVACKQLRQIELVGHCRMTLQKEVSAAKSLAIIVGLFALCWLPLHILNCLTLFYPAFKASKPEWSMHLTIILSHTNSVVNPIIYAYRIRDFRYTFRKILTRYVLCKNEDFPKGSKGSIGGSSRHLEVNNVNTSPTYV